MNSSSSAAWSESASVLTADTAMVADALSRSSTGDSASSGISSRSGSGAGAVGAGSVAIAGADASSIVTVACLGGMYSILCVPTP